jgi:hypothetical protein
MRGVFLGTRQRGPGSTQFGPVRSVSCADQSKGVIVRRSMSIVPCAAAFALMLSGSVHAQGTPQTVTLMKVDPQTLATGYRTSKMVGSTVVNESNQTVGTIDDLIVTPGGQTPYAVLSVGGFLGLGSKYVVVPFTSLKIVDKKMVLPGGSKEALEALPAFRYAS